MRRGLLNQIAREVGASRGYINDIFTGRRRPSHDTAAKLERVTGIDRRAWVWPDEFPNDLLIEYRKKSKKRTKRGE